MAFVQFFYSGEKYAFMSSLINRLEKTFLTMGCNLEGQLMFQNRGEF